MPSWEDVAKGAVRHFEGPREPFRSIPRDVGAACIGLVALSLQRAPAGLTTGNLTTTCCSKQLSGRGRVLAFVKLCLRHGEMIFVDDAQPWTRRKLAIQPGLIDAYRERSYVEFDAMVKLAPEVAPLRSSLADDQTFLRMMMWILLLTQERPDILLNHASNPAMELFVYRDAGMLMLFDLLGGQRPDRTRLLEAASISRYGFAKRWVSWVHVARMSSEGEAHGLMSFPAMNRVAFTPALSEALERQSAQLMQWLRASVMATCGPAVSS